MHDREEQLWREQDDHPPALAWSYDSNNGPQMTRTERVVTGLTWLVLLSMIGTQLYFIIKGWN